MKTITTYGELKNALPSTGTCRVPGINQLRKKATVLLHHETDSGIIEIYDNGFYTFEECGHLTVYGVDRCERPETYTYGGRKEAGSEPQDFSSYPWDMILESAASARLSHNDESRGDYLGQISLDDPASENNPAFSVKPEYEVREEEEEAALRKREMLTGLEKGLCSLKPRQREVLQLRFVDELTLEEIGKRMGITKGTVCVNLERALKRAQKNSGQC